MEPNQSLSSENVKVIEWEDFEQELARLWNSLQEKLNSLLQVKAESLNRSNELEEMQQRLDDRKFVTGDMSMQSKIVEEDIKKKEERLGLEVRSLLVAGTALSVSRNRLQDANRLLSGERGYVHLKNLEKMLRVRQQHMISQVSFLYPVKPSIGSLEQELESFPSSSRAEDEFFTDKKEVQRSATALGYVAHAVSLIASYLEVPLRYPLRLGGSRSYINDYAPSIEPTPTDSVSNSLLLTNLKHIEFPLFLEGQDTTRAAYAVFLLNKDLEQLLNFIGVKSLGPRHVLANLKELLRTILSPEFIDA
ncbi:hypothetical protein AAG906_007499 [Vitis piasezkii]